MIPSGTETSQMRLESGDRSLEENEEQGGWRGVAIADCRSKSGDRHDFQTAENRVSPRFLLCVLYVAVFMDPCTKKPRLGSRRRSTTRAFLTDWSGPIGTARDRSGLQLLMSRDVEDSFGAGRRGRDVRAYQPIGKAAIAFASVFALGYVCWTARARRLRLL